MKKILFVVHAFGVGGVGTVLTNIANGLAQRGYDITIVVTSNQFAGANNLLPQVRLRHKDEPKFVLLKKIPYIRNYFGSGMWSTRQTPRQLYRYFIGEQQKYDVEIAFFFGRPVRAVYGSPNQTSRKVLWVHMDYKKTDGHLLAFRNKEEATDACNRFDNIVCVSKSAEDSFKEVTGRCKGVRTIYNLNDIEKIISLSREKANICRDRFTFVTVGRLSEEKGVIRLLETVTQLIQEGYSFDVWIVGTGSEEKRLKQYVEDKGLTNVTMLGLQENPYKYMNLADCYVCTSFFEGFSMVLSEAVILGKPVVTTEVSGARELFGDSEYGLVVDNSMQGIYVGLKKMLDDAIYSRYKAEIKKRKRFLESNKILDEIEILFNQGV